MHDSFTLVSGIFSINSFRPSFELIKSPKYLIIDIMLLFSLFRFFHFLSLLSLLLRVLDLLSAFKDLFFS